jgi:hypothetical protein
MQHAQGLEGEDEEPKGEEEERLSAPALGRSATPTLGSQDGRTFGLVASPKVRHQ